MSTVAVTVELPQYNLSLVVDVSEAGTVLDIKQEIARVCPGRPRADGQRLITKGRILDDEETVDAIWGTNEVRVIHLAVNPWSWSSTPPRVPDARIAETHPTPSSAIATATGSSLSYVHNIQPPSIPSLFQPTPTLAPPLQPYNPLGFILHMHNRALQTLSPTTPLSSFSTENSATLKDVAKQTLAAYGYAWPPIFDPDFPPQTAGGVTYEYTIISGQPYLQSLTPYAAPTPCQQHALNVLAYTFPLLSLPNIIPSPSPYGMLANMQQPRIPNLHLGAAHGAMNANAGAAVPQPEVRAVRVAIRVPVRAILTPLILLSIRTMLLLYFFTPARKPIFGLMIGVWVLYEAWGAVRGAIVENIHANANGIDVPQQPGQADNGAAPGRGAAGGAFVPGQVPNAAPRVNAGAGIPAPNVDVILSRLAQLDLENEQRELDREDANVPEPSLLRKACMFAGLLVLTLHPAYWNRRRTALSAREGRVRTEANAREAALREATLREAEAEQQQGPAGDGTERIEQISARVGPTVDERARRAREQLLARHTRRARWIQNYIGRVQRGEWLDD